MYAIAYGYHKANFSKKDDFAEMIAFSLKSQGFNGLSEEWTTVDIG